MAEICPHCLAKLPPVRDAFCPECRNDLDKAPLAARQPADVVDYGQHQADWAGSSSRQRPVGISILAVLHFGGGILLGTMQFLLYARLAELEEPLRTVGLSPALIAVGLAFLALVGIASGVGMWLGRTWGWWLGAFYYVYAIARSGSALLSVAELQEELAGSTRGPEYYYVKYTGRIVVHALIGWYLFRPHVLRYFGLEGLSKWKAVAILSGACLAIGVAASAVGGITP